MRWPLPALRGGSGLNNSLTSPDTDALTHVQRRECLFLMYLRFALANKFEGRCE